MLISLRLHRYNSLRREPLAEYAMRAHQAMTFFVPERRGHDDLLNAAALVVQAAPLGRLRTATARRAGRVGDRG